jgi:hypothetical protein
VKFKKSLKKGWKKHKKNTITWAQIIIIITILAGVLNNYISLKQSKIEIQKNKDYIKNSNDWTYTNLVNIQKEVNN